MLTLWSVSVQSLIKMGRVKIKHPRPKEIATRRKLLEIFSPNIRAHKLIPTHDAIIALTDSDKDSDYIFQPNKIEELHKENFNPIMPPELKSKRTVICLRLDEIVYDNEPEDIKHEVERGQPWAKVKEVYKFPRSNTIKITFLTSEMAGKACETGLLMFHMAITTSQIKEETYTPLVTCNKCYAVESHETKQCPTPQDYKVCSECGSNEHIYTGCRSAQKSCINCGQAHSARAMKCQVRKQALKEKEDKIRKDKEQKNIHSYALATQAQDQPSSTVPESVMIGCVCLINAHMVNAARPGMFQQTLAESLSLNGLPMVKLPPSPPSTEIMRAIFNSSTNIQSNAHTETESNGPNTQKSENQDMYPNTPQLEPQEPQGNNLTGPQDRDPSDSNSDISDSQSESDVDIASTNTVEDETSFKPVIIYKKDSDRWPKEPSARNILKGVKDGRYKLKHNGRREDTQKAINWISDRQGTLAGICKTVEDEKFSIITSVPMNNHSQKPQYETRGHRRKAN